MNGEQRTALVDALVFNREQVALLLSNYSRRVIHARVDLAFHHGAITGLQQAVDVLTGDPDAWEEIQRLADGIVRYEGDNEDEDDGQ